MNIQKTTITLTVLHPAGERPDKWGLEQIAYEINDGAWLGRTAHVSTVPVPKKSLRDECLALGNDGTFFETD